MTNSVLKQDRDMCDECDGHRDKKLDVRLEYEARQFVNDNDIAITGQQ